jgi:transposase
MVVETLAPGASVTEVARRHDVHPNLLHVWRKQARTGALTMANEPASDFVPVRVAAGEGIITESNGTTPAIEVVLRNGRVLRISDRATPERVVALADALEARGR